MKITYIMILLPAVLFPSGCSDQQPITSPTPVPMSAEQQKNYRRDTEEHRKKYFSKLIEDSKNSKLKTQKLKIDKLLKRAESLKSEINMLDKEAIFLSKALWKSVTESNDEREKIRIENKLAKNKSEYDVLYRKIVNISDELYSLGYESHRDVLP